MSISIDGNDLVWDGEVRITNFTNPETGVVTLVLTPAGGVGALPVFAEGPAGLPPIIDSITTVQVDPAVDLPAPELDLVSPGGPGVASHYTMTFYVHQGLKGDTGNSGAILTSVDLESPGATPSDGYVMAFNASTGKIRFISQRVGGLYIPTSIDSSSGNSFKRTLTQVTVPAQAFSWRPIPWAQTVVTGTSKIRVNLVSRLNDALTGAQVGLGFGVAGSLPPVTMIPASPGADYNTTTYGVVPQGQSATVYLQAEQQNTSTSDSWTTSATTTAFSVLVQAV